MKRKPNCAKVPLRKLMKKAFQVLVYCYKYGRVTFSDGGVAPRTQVLSW